MYLVEQYETITGSNYALYSTGKGFKTVITHPEHTLPSGRIVGAFTTERRHGSYSAAINSKLRRESKDNVLAQITATH